MAFQLTPLTLGLAALGLVVVGGAASSSRKRKKGGVQIEGMPEPIGGGQEELRYLMEWAFLDPQWMAFLECQAKRESGFNNFRGLGLPELFPEWAKPTDTNFQTQQNEADAAAKGYERNKYLHDCPWPRSRYVFGSGGWFGLLPATGVAVFRNTRYACIDPWSVFDPPASLVMAMGYADGLQNWKGFKKEPTWLNLRVGWGNPSKMGNPSSMANVESKFGDRLESLGYPRSLMYNTVTPLPADIDHPADLLDALLEVY